MTAHVPPPLPWLANPSVGDRRLIRECVAAALWGPYIPDGDFEILFGMSRRKAKGLERAVRDELPANDARWLVYSALVHLTGYPVKGGDPFAEDVGGTREEVEELLWRWREENGLADQTRDHLRAEMARLVALDPESRWNARRRVDDVAESAERYGLDVPPELRWER